MRKLVSLMHVSLDGFAAGPNDELNWIMYNPDVEKNAHDLIYGMDATMYGRVTYEGMKSYWPIAAELPETSPAEVAYAHWVNGVPKYVISNSLESSDWAGTVFVRGDLAAEVNAIKQQPGKAIALLGSPTTVRALAALDLIDEYHVNINPVILGVGKPALAGTDHPPQLKLVESTTLKGGVIHAVYAPIRR